MVSSPSHPSRSLSVTSRCAPGRKRRQASDSSAKPSPCSYTALPPSYLSPSCQLKNSEDSPRNDIAKRPYRQQSLHDTASGRRDHVRDWRGDFDGQEPGYANEEADDALYLSASRPRYLRDPVRCCSAGAMLSLLSRRTQPKQSDLDRPRPIDCLGAQPVFAPCCTPFNPDPLSRPQEGRCSSFQHSEKKVFLPQFSP